MIGRPNWISDQPVEIEIDSLQSFARYIEQELNTNVRPNVSNVLAKLGPPADKSFGRDADYPMGARIGNYHSDCVEKGRVLMEKLELGLQAIAWAAHNIANDFETVDEQNSMDLTRVDGYFNPKDRSRSLAETGLPPQPPADQS